MKLLNYMLFVVLVCFVLILFIWVEIVLVNVIEVINVVK